MFVRILRRNFLYVEDLALKKLMLILITYIDQYINKAIFILSIQSSYYIHFLIVGLLPFVYSVFTTHL